MSIIHSPQSLEQTNIEWFIEAIKEYNPAANLAPIYESYSFSKMKHEGQFRKSGDPYFIHCMGTARNLIEWRMDVDTIAAGFLHDVLEDTDTIPEELREKFGEEITHIVEGVSKISLLPFRGIESQAENFRKMILAMSKDIRVTLIKLADRLHNMRTLEYLPHRSQLRIAGETLDIYGPLAQRLGMAEVSAELQDISFKYLNKEIHQELEERVEKEIKDRGKYIENLSQVIAETLKQSGLNCKVKGRRKSLYSIYQKMQSRDIPFEDIHDLFAFRVLVDTVGDCYAGLGMIHSRWKPVPGKIKDYIATPKTNGYQSLHTTVIGPGGKPLEIQIRTQEMHEVAEHGIAAHWRYKEGSTASAEDARFLWLRRIVEDMQELKNPRHFMESVKLELFPEEVYVFTPKGEVKGLPKGATPIDFAYSIHTEVGHQCIGAKVNGATVPLKEELKSGDIVEIITRSGSNPSRDWLRFAKSSRARGKIRHWIREAEREESIQLGQDLLEGEIQERRLDINMKKLLKSDELLEAANELNLTSIDDLLAHLGYGKVSAPHVINLIAPESIEKPAAKPAQSDKTLRQKLKGSVKVGGLGQQFIRFAKCCNPIPGDEIVGYITRGRGVTVHRANCPEISGDTERIIQTQWEDEKESVYTVEISIESDDRKGMLAEVTAAIAKESVNIESGNISTADAKAATSFTVQVNDLDHLSRLMDSISKIKGIKKVERKN
ncbi:RelA/SpoT family protein [Candidatus Poribacteria bacterium]|nr:RelA/SpoT family protein [Candidatus Poribacteria bacterium]